MPKRIKMFSIFLIILILIYLTISLILFLSQRSLLYHPVENNYFGDDLKVKIEDQNQYFYAPQLNKILVVKSEWVLNHEKSNK